MKNDSLINSNKGYMTIEASIIVPTILIAIMTIIVCLIFVYERSVVASSEYEALYTIPVKNIRDDSVTAYLSGRNYEEGLAYGNCSINTEYSWHMAKCEGVLHIYSDSEIDGRREIDQCVERLRRWQLYDDLADQ